MIKYKKQHYIIYARLRIVIDPEQIKTAQFNSYGVTPYMICFNKAHLLRYLNIKRTRYWSYHNHCLYGRNIYEAIFMIFACCARKGVPNDLIEYICEFLKPNRYFTNISRGKVNI